MVVATGPVRQWLVGFGARREVVLAPELLLVDAVTALDFPVLLRPARFDVAMPDPGGLDGELEGQRKLRAVVALQFTNREWQAAAHLVEEVQAGVLVLTRIQTEHAEARAVVDRCTETPSLAVASPP